MEKKNQAKWAHRNEQVNFSMHLGDILNKTFGPGFNCKYQGGGKVANLVVLGHGINPKKIKEIKNFLIKTYGISPTDISKNHGHTNGTVVVNVSEISEESRNKVEEDFKKMMIDPILVNKMIGKIKSVVIIEKESEINCENIESQTPETINEEKQTILKPEIMEKISLIRNGRISISNFLTIVFKFEGVLSDKNNKIFTFDENHEGDMQVIIFRTIEEATIANQALTWFFGSEAKDGPVQDGKEIMLNFFSLDIAKNKQRPVYVSFTLSPVMGEQVEDIARRAKRALTGYTPSLIEILNDESFKISYSRLTTTQKFLELIQEMGWDAKMEDGVIIGQFAQKRFVTTAKMISPRDLVNSNPVIQTEEDSKTDAMIAIKKMFTPAEAIARFKDIYNDDNRWAAVSPEKKEKITGILRNDLQSNTQLFATYILYLQSESRPLFTKEESVAAFRSIMVSPDFKSLPIEIQNGILSAMKDSLSDEEILDGLLDMF